MSDLYLPANYSQLSVSPAEFFGTPTYDCFPPPPSSFLRPTEMELCLTDPFRKACAISAAAAAMAAAVAEQNTANLHRTSYSAYYYYDAMMSNRKEFSGSRVPTASTLAATIMNNNANIPKPAVERQILLTPETHSQHNVHGTRLPAMGIASTGPETHSQRMTTESPARLVVQGSAHAIPELQRKKSPKWSSPKRIHSKPSPRTNRAWSCQCSCPSDADGSGMCAGTRTLTPDSPHEMDMFVAGAERGVAPFECAKSFIRRRNARERERVRCVNAGYELLRRRLPLASMSDRRLAKVEILRGAISYINSLKDMLDKTP